MSSLVGGGKVMLASPHFPAAALGGAQSSLYKLKFLKLQIHFLSYCLFSSNTFNKMILKNSKAHLNFKTKYVFTWVNKVKL